MVVLAKSTRLQDRNCEDVCERQWGVQLILLFRFVGKEKCDCACHSVVEGTVASVEMLRLSWTRLLHC